MVRVITVESIVDHRQYLWRMFFGIAFFKNNLTVLHSSPLTEIVFEEKYPVACEYLVETFSGKSGTGHVKGFTSSTLAFYTILGTQLMRKKDSSPDGRRKDVSILKLGWGF